MIGITIPERFTTTLAPTPSPKFFTNLALLPVTLDTVTPSNLTGVMCKIGFNKPCLEIFQEIPITSVSADCSKLGCLKARAQTGLFEEVSRPNLSCNVKSLISMIMPSISTSTVSEIFFLILKDWLKTIKIKKNISLTVDVDPINFK
jgi:hypothetical protein